MFDAKAFARAALARGLTLEQALRLHRLHATVARLMGHPTLSYRMRLAAIIAADTRTGQVMGA